MDDQTDPSHPIRYPEPDSLNIKTEENSNLEPDTNYETPRPGEADSEEESPDTGNLKEAMEKEQEVEEAMVTVKEEFLPEDHALPPVPVLTKRRRTVLSLAEKADLLRRLREGASQKQLALEFGIGTSTVSDLKKHEAEILGYVAANGDEVAMGRRKMEPVGARADVEEAVLSWLMQEAGNGREVTGQQVQARARQEHQRLRGIDGQFQASPGWLERFRRRYNLRSGRPRRGRRRGRQLARQQQESPPPSFKCEEDEEDCESGIMCPEAVQPLVSVEEGHVSVQLPPVQDVPTAAEAATLLSRALVWAAAQQDTTPQQLFVIKQLQTRAALRGIMKGGLS
ncbi:hypothetical protein Pcinc_020040 [Petrolisthes cinctipes]|uniref:HTH CENPB-type domain-containing protein n=1 Tax=Petrolisthes cinctipes TaxID=88211 RepID=A0AAE1FIX4_PETCI|nr:hypothetical protein Pcinc_020040 [Petrolisthes cinctipes]